MHINDIAIEGLLDTDVDVRIITLVYWHAIWPLKDTHFLEIGTLFQVKQSTNSGWNYGARGQKQSLLSCVSNITVNWMGHDLLLQKNTQVNILYSPKLIFRERKSWGIIKKLLAIQVVQQYRILGKPSELLTVLPLIRLTENHIWLKEWL